MVLNRLRSYVSTIRQRKKNYYIQRLISKGMKLGNGVAILDPFFFDPDHCFLISIGDGCTLAPNVRLIAHDASSKKLVGATRFGRITIGANCFLGDSVIVLPNVSIGQDSIIGAGSVVTRDVPPGSVAVGNPASVLMATMDYVQRLQVQKEGRRVFDESYHIGQLNMAKVVEMLDDVDQNAGIGFVQ